MKREFKRYAHRNVKYTYVLPPSKLHTYKWTNWVKENLLQGDNYYVV